MKFIYKNKEKIDPIVKEELEDTLTGLKKKYKFLDDSDQVHIEIERLKNLSWSIKINWWVSKIGKKLISLSLAENVRKSINLSREKLTTQIEKIKIRR